MAKAADKDASQPAGIEWHKGPYLASIGTVAQIQVPKGYAFTDSAGTRRFLELAHNPSSEADLGMVLPISDEESKDKNTNSSADWFVLFSFDEVGYIKDTEKSSLDANKIFTSLQKNTEEENEYRKQHGWASFHLVRWQTPPFYDGRTNNLTWSTLGRSEDAKEGDSINYSTRYLGRQGAMSADLVLDPTEMDYVLPRYQVLMSGFSFKTGSRYADFVKGDKVAEYGLTALIAGGAAAVAMKTGLFTKLLVFLGAMWKAIAVFFIALATRLKAIIKKIRLKFSSKHSDDERQKEIETQANKSDL
ncbi:MAG: DUF2167 domain-containing protein [Acidobacteriaceae bacterium]|nr:DUF2167 domain-containing protein [Acidobacteriaceae bacterium]